MRGSTPRLATKYNIMYAREAGPRERGREKDGANRINKTNETNNKENDGDGRDDDACRGV